MKQIGLALHNYHYAVRSLPSGILKKEVSNVLGVTCWGWGSFILPYMEQQALHDAIYVGVPSLYTAVGTAAIRSHMQEEFSAFRCPSDNQPPTNTTRTIQGHALACSSYVANNSSDVFMPTTDSDGDDSVTGGVFLEGRGLRFADIRDGTSNTVAMGERSWDFRDINGALQLSRSAIIFGVGDRTNYDRRGDQLACGVYRMNLDGTDQSNSATQNRGMEGYSSRHPGGANFVLVDGSVRFVSETIEGRFNNAGVATDAAGSTNEATRKVVDTTWERILARQDGQPIGDW